MALSDLLEEEDARYISIADLVDSVMEADSKLKSREVAALALLKMFQQNKIRRLPTLFVMADHKLWEDSSQHNNYDGYGGWTEEEHFLGILKDIASGKKGKPTPNNTLLDLDDDLPF